MKESLLISINLLILYFFNLILYIGLKEEIKEMWTLMGYDPELKAELKEIEKKLENVNKSW